jgi:hypothetical protein
MSSVLEEKEAIRDLISAYCFYVDNGEFDKFAGLFTEDAIFEAGPFGGSRAGGRFMISSRHKSRVPAKVPRENIARSTMSSA